MCGSSEVGGASFWRHPPRNPLRCGCADVAAALRCAATPALRELSAPSRPGPSAWRDLHGMNSTGRSPMTQSILKAAAGIAALAAIAFGASAIASGSKSNNASFAGAPPGMAAGGANGQAPPGANGQVPPATGQTPQGAPPAGAQGGRLGLGTP